MRAWTLPGAFLLWSCLFGCGRLDEELVLVFPDESSRDATSAIAVTLFEPLRILAEKDTPEFVKCSEIGVFNPTRTIDPEQFASIPNLGRFLSSPREQTSFPFDGSWSVTIPQVDSESRTNPWGALLVFIEARGQARAPESEGGGPVVGTLLQGCYCLRTRQGTHEDRVLDQAVKATCRSIEDKEAEREIELSAVTPSPFKLSVHGVRELTAPRGEVLAPGPIVEISAPRCDDTTAMTADCFKCQQPCDRLRDRSRVPVVFTVEGGGVTPSRQVALTDARGRARADLSVGDCAGPIKLRAEIAGRPDRSFEFGIKCVDPIDRFECQPETILGAQQEPIAMVRVPGGNQRHDAIAILSDSDSGGVLEIMNAADALSTSIRFPADQSPLALHAFLVDLDEGSRPVVAVATASRGPSAGDAGSPVSVYVFDWTGASLVPQSGGAAGTLGSPVTGCAQPCDCERCSCGVFVATQSVVSMRSADLNGDRKADLVLGSDLMHPMTMFLAGADPSGPIFGDRACKCAQFAQFPGSFEFLELGGPGGSAVDLVILSMSGAYIRYGDVVDGAPMFTCGQSNRFGVLAPMRDVARGRFSCDRSTAACAGYDDLVLVSGNTLQGGGFDDPGTISLIFGTADDVSLVPGEALFDKEGSALELPPRTFEGALRPKDPRRVTVGDLNGDGHDDLAVLYGASSEVHVWLGRSAKSLGEVAHGVRLSEACGRSERRACVPLKSFALADLDGDGRDEIHVICDPATSTPRLRRYVPSVLRR